MRFVFIICSLLLGSLVAKSSPLLDSLKLIKKNNGAFVIHQVDDQETLYSIARRYGGSVDSIIKHNQITKNKIEIGQIIEILIMTNATELDHKNDFRGLTGWHQVTEGETLYSISRKYQVKVKELKKWNDMEGTVIGPGMILRISDPTETDVTTILEKDPMDEIDTLSVDPLADFENYLVQTGETLSSIARKIGVKLDSLRVWNNLTSDYLRIGQSLLVKTSQSEDQPILVESSGGKTTRIDEDGFERIYEEGVASVIETMKTNRYLALHRSLPIGTNLEIRNLMNNQIVYVKVVGKLPDTGLNKNLLLRVSRPAYDQLGILDSRSRVEVSYYKK